MLPTGVMGDMWGLNIELVLLRVEGHDVIMFRGPRCFWLEGEVCLCFRSIPKLLVSWEKILSDLEDPVMMGISALDDPTMIGMSAFDDPLNADMSALDDPVMMGISDLEDMMGMSALAEPVSIGIWLNTALDGVVPGEGETLL